MNVDLPAAARFQKDGYTIIEGALSSELLSSLRQLSEQRLAEEEAEHFDAFRFHGSMLQLDPCSDETTCELVTNPATLSGLSQLGFPEPKWLSAYMISKPPDGPPLWWHQDWWAWDEECSFDPVPPQIFVMYYLRDVDEHNGALRVIPGSHLRSHELHHLLPPAHSREMDEAAENGAAHASQPDEITVGVRAGDAVVGDVRLLHATHPNRDTRRRTCLTLWYLPAFGNMPDSIKSYVIDHPAQPPREWWRQRDNGVPERLEPFLPTYEGSSAPARYNRQPPADWGPQAFSAT